MKRKVKKWFSNLKLSWKMLVAWSGFFVLFCGISLTALQVSLNIYDEELYEKSLQELDFYVQRVNRGLGEMDELSKSIALDDDIQGLLMEMQEMEYLSAKYSMKLYDLRRKIWEKANLYPDLKTVIYTDGKQVNVSQGIDTGEIPESLKLKLLQEFKDAKGGYCSEAPSEEYPYVLSGREILESRNASLKYLGSLLLVFDPADIIERERKNLESINSELFVFSDRGTIYKADEMSEKFRELPGEKGYDVVRKAGKRYFICWLTSKNNGWTYVNYFPYSDIYGRVMTIRYILIIGFIGLFCVTLVVLTRVAVAITRPLERLSQSMKIVENGDFESALNVLEREPGKDEIGILTNEFRVMLEKIQYLIHENYEKQLLLKDTSYKMLQAQINPHFIYNTLNTLNWLIRGKKNEDAGKMLIEFANILRSSFAKDPYITVSEELEAVQGYMMIQKYRYQRRVEFAVEVQEKLPEYRIPRMILQPLVENGILYGMENYLQICRITLRIWEDEDWLNFSVEDTGKGMDSEELEAVRNGTIVPKGNGIGLQNIRKRLGLMYQNSSFVIESQLGKGTEIHIQIPLKEVEIIDV